MPPSRKTVFLHIGHGKTGTSAIQAFLARSHNDLKNYGWLYPHHSSFSKALQGHISCGNVAVTSRSQDWVSQLRAIVRSENQYHSFIFSGESMFGHIEPLLSSFGEWEKEVDIVVLLAVRNPLEMLASEYQQNVKRGGQFCSYAEFVEKRDFLCVHTVKASRLVRRMDEQSIPYKLFNYSFLQRGIASALLSSIDFPISYYPPSDDLIVNRSHTASELLSVRLLNALFGRETGMRVSDALVNQLPDLKSDMPSLDQQRTTQVVKAMSSDVEVLNQRLPIDMPLVLQSPSTSCDSGFDIPLTINDDQRDVAKSALVGSLYPKGAARLLRSVAEKAITKEPITSAEALMILQIVMQVNPRMRRRTRGLKQALQSMSISA